MLYYRRQFHRAVRSGFTLVELVVTMGVVLVLLGIALPAAGGSIAHARLTRNIVQVRQDLTLISTYSNDHKDVYPIAHPLALISAYYWYRPLEKLQYISNPSAVDPAGVRKAGGVTLMMSMCMVRNTREMQPGWTVPEEVAGSAPVYQHQVTYPSAKGLMVQLFDRWTPDPSYGFFCCSGKPWRAAAGFADGSATSGTRFDFSGGHPITLKDGVGIPIFSTWGGYLARDR